MRDTNERLPWQPLRYTPGTCAEPAWRHDEVHTVMFASHVVHAEPEQLRDEADNIAAVWRVVWDEAFTVPDSTVEDKQRLLDVAAGILAWTFGDWEKEVTEHGDVAWDWDAYAEEEDDEP